MVINNTNSMDMNKARQQSVVIFGATSAIAYEAAKQFAAEGARLFLCARREDDLQRLAGDLAVRGAAEVQFATFNAMQPKSIAAAVQKIRRSFTEIDCLLLAHGYLPNLGDGFVKPELLEQTFAINFTSTALLIEHFVPYFEKRQEGSIAVISSVAGDRGRGKNYPYCAAKAALTAYVSGLRQRLHPLGIHVLTIKPGFVATPMTARLPQNALFADAGAVGRGVHRAIKRRREVVYLPGYWRLIMAVVKAMPEAIFKRLQF